ncbi:bumetanide-sensitive sodium-(potassium)-chloride cotransporter isoform X1 [Colletes gigas]|uniref:bumetanide-sensitive sodium-(potassium)-chloride cotransporter isoform X1 n=1 Tax=Colletes gigas TaxID=935657 RepID=UPI001C9B012C|nr:bumetanide-sensitive sodium-(potassium)-chloride cotransporter isoform X1 [Colletes gigas]XP_043264396.1 bumetanide-sensitive sodium-(potassium)-chloride cotransporter isoform X1 [Colletes gigas]XP_043264397.1 bumetanide-sensitive sodium-(potassium)-chloride cotransporter isoform X1 [Colletes gigas]
MDDEVISGNQNNKRSPMTLNVSGLWDVVPRLDHYRLSRRAKRPSLSTLHEGNLIKDPNIEAGQIGTSQQKHTGIKLGWIQGVLIPCLLNIWGVMLFLRLSWVVAQAGILHSVIIIGISAAVCVITTLSLSAISTNGEVKGGGIYFIISRTLGAEFGASVGIVFAFANAVSASMNTIGFCDSLNDLLREHNLKIIDNGVNDVRIVGIFALIAMIMVCAVGMEWESKAQNFLIAIIVAAIFDFLIGTIMGPSSIPQKAHGFIGFSSEVFMSNLGTDYRFSENSNQTFFSVFAIFFPSVTGIQAGANISGDLKDPASSIPIGTLLALLISMLSYLTFVLFAGGAALRDASGLVGANNTIINCIPQVNCTFGLHNSYSVMQLMSVWGPFIYAGCFAATLSTALTNLLSVPRLIQALGQDRIYPGLIYFSKGYGKHGEPYRGYVLTFFVAVLFLLIANLNAVAPLISNFYLASYALINFCTFHAALIRPIGWRPTFRYYNTWLSLFGFITCVAIMFLIDWVTSLVTFVIIFALYLIVVYRKPDVNWGSSTQAQTYKTALSTVYRLNSMDSHVKNYAPQILALTGPPSSRPALLHLANLITKNHSLLICGEVYPTNLSYRFRSVRLRNGYGWLHQQRIKSFYHVVEDLSFERGASALMQASGVGKLAPNVVLMGYKTHWSTCNHKDLQEYFNVLHNAFDQKLAVAMLRIAEGLDCSGVVIANGDEEHGALAQSSYDLTGSTLMHVDSNLSMSSQIPRVQSVPTMGTPFVPVDGPQIIRDSPTHGSARDHLKHKKKHAIEKLMEKRHAMATVPEHVTIFQRKHKSGTIDVWWLYDDGGLTILLPYIISTRSNWEHCKMRIFALANHKQDIVAQEKEMSEIMSKFRIKYTSLKMVDDISVEPKQETQDFFDKLISDFRKNDPADTECCVTELELQSLKDKTHRQLRLRELLLENSSQSTLVVMSLPMPRKGAVSAPLYMAWLEALTRDMPPTLLIRGNHTSVLTFYS